MSATSPSERIAVLFPGQGAQHVGMGQALRATDPGLFEHYVGLAEDIANRPIRRLCLEGPHDALTHTEVSQPAIVAVSLAVAELARQMGLQGAFAAGHSLGEYTAAVVAGALDERDALHLVAYRGRLMAALQERRPGTMAAVVGIPSAVVAELCSAAGQVTVANLNTPSQTVVSGTVAGVGRLVELVRQNGARAVRLPVDGAFHSPLMEPARVALDQASEGVRWSAARVPVAANARGELISDAEDVRASLVAQVTAPVRFVDCVRALLAAGCTRFVELGPGRVLSGLVRKIEPSADVVSADSRAGLAALLEADDDRRAA